MIFPPPPALVTHTGNWAGYSWHSSTKADAEWKVPRFPWKTPLSPSEKENKTGLALWTGLGTGPIEQIGIYDHVTNGVVGWYGVYEFYPEPPVGVGQAISPGDDIIAHVTRSGFTYTLSLQDKGKWSVSIKKVFKHVENQGEMVAESYAYAPTGSDKLTGFSPVTAKVSGNPVNEIVCPWGWAHRDSNHQITIHG